MSSSSIRLLPLRPLSKNLQIKPRYLNSITGPGASRTASTTTPTSPSPTTTPRNNYSKPPPNAPAAKPAPKFQYSKPPTTTTTTPPAAKPSASAAVPTQPLPDAPRTPTPQTDESSSSSSSSSIDWTSSYHGIGSSSFSPESAAVLLAPIDPDDIEVKPDGIIFLPEIKYRRILNAAFGPGGWGLAPRGELMVMDRLVTREYALVVHGRFVAQARGEQQYFQEDGVPTAAEGAKSNALMRCCKDLGIASELWDPRFIRRFTKEKAKQVWVEHVVTKKKKQIWLRKDDEVRYPFKTTSFNN
ncbi:Mgm101p-domain-containing protein [Poronia punctata]|nr:Mgm101p-domain-containing protein [Poronia punctata]